MRRSTVLSLPLQLLFPGSTIGAASPKVAKAITPAVSSFSAANFVTLVRFKKTFSNFDVRPTSIVASGARFEPRAAKNGTLQT